MFFNRAYNFEWRYYFLNLFIVYFFNVKLNKFLCILDKLEIIYDVGSMEL